MKSSSCRILLVGLGGLGCPALLALIDHGFRAFTLVDEDEVDLTNLHRQVLYRIEDLGRPKVLCAADRVRKSHPGLDVVAVQLRVEPGNVRPMFLRHSLVIDGTDTPAAKMMLSDASKDTGIPLIYGGVLRTSGQAMAILPQGPCLRCLFEDVSSDSPSCSQAGVMGSVAGIIGAIQADLATRVLNQDSLVAGQLILFNGDTLTTRTLSISRSPSCVQCQ